MLFVIVLLSVLAVIDAAPSNMDRVKRSNHDRSWLDPVYDAAPSYAPSQCGATYYHVAQAPHAHSIPYGYQHAQPAPYGHQHAQPAPYHSYKPQYRSSFDVDFTSLQDMEHMAPMRAYVGYDAAAAAASGPAPGPYGQAVGLYPRANVGGCRVPLLVSCSPSITQGQMLKSSGHYGAAGAAPAVAHDLPVQILLTYRGAKPTTETHNEHKHGLNEAGHGQNHLNAATVQDHKPKHVDKSH